MAVRCECDHDARTLESDVGDVDAANQQREPADMSDQALDRERRVAPVGSSPSADVVEASRAGGETADTETSDRAPPASRPVTALISALTASLTVSAGIRSRGDGEHEKAHAGEGANGNSNPFEAGGERSRNGPFRRRRSTLCSSKGRRKLRALCDAFVAGNLSPSGAGLWCKNARNAIARHGGGFRHG